MKRFFSILFICALCAVCAVAASARSVMMIGDSHVAGKSYPRTVDSLLSAAVDSCEFCFFGINGASFATFCKPENLDTIYRRQPDVLLVHLGTNDSYGRTFNPDTFLDNMAQFYSLVHDSVPEVKMVFITPFVNKQKRSVRTKRKKKRRRYTTVWNINENTRKCADAMVSFVHDHPDDTDIINHNADHGMDFLNNGLISRDFVHLTVPGYVMLASQVTEELLKLPLFAPEQAPAPDPADEYEQ